MVRHTRWIASADVDETNGSVNCRQVEMSAFDHPRGEPDDLPGQKGFQHREPADHGIADL